MRRWFNHCAVYLAPIVSSALSTIQGSPVQTGHHRAVRTKELRMGLLVSKRNAKRSARPVATPAPGGGGMSKTAMALLAFLELKAFRGFNILSPDSLTRRRVPRTPKAAAIHC